MITQETLIRLLNEYEPKMKRFFSGKVTNQLDRDDLYQEATYAIIKSYQNFKKKSSLSTWIYSICRNILYTYYYKKKRVTDIYERLKERTPKDEHDMIILHMVLKKLPPLYKNIYDLRYRKGYSIKELAKMLERPEGTIKYLLYQLRGKLKEELT